MMIFPFITSTDATSSIVCNEKCEELDMNILKIEIFWTITNRSRSGTKNIAPPFMNKINYLYNKRTPIYFRDIISLSVYPYVKFLSWIG